MSPIAAILDLLLAGLLTAALAVGLQLNRRLKTLRDGQAGFAAAVIELNQAAARADSGLAALKAASEEAHDSLLARIETARALVTRLERAGAGASVERAPELAVAAAASAPRFGAGSDAIRTALAEIARTKISASAVAAPGAPPPATGGSAPPIGGPPPVGGVQPTARRHRPTFDADLFEEGGEIARLDLGPLHTAASVPASGLRLKAQRR